VACATGPGAQRRECKSVSAVEQRPCCPVPVQTVRNAVTEA
jgi:hypothetical protein